MNAQLRIELENEEYRKTLIEVAKIDGCNAVQLVVCDLDKRDVYNLTLAELENFNNTSNELEN